jgi:hypothetical protein
VKKIKRERKDEDEEQPALMSTSQFIREKRDAIMIDRNALDEMWVMQPQIYHDIAERTAMEISRRDEAKDMLREIEATIDAELREAADIDFQKNGVKKPTETAIKNMVRDDVRWKRANKAHAELEGNVALLGALKESFMQRRYALQDLVTLHVSGYGMDASSKPSRDARYEDNKQRMNKLRKGQED